MTEQLSSLVTLAELIDQLGDCKRYPAPCDCLTCAAVRRIQGPS